MSSASLSNTCPVESILRWQVQNLSSEYKSDFAFAVYNSLDQRLIGNIWKRHW